MFIRLFSCLEAEFDSFIDKLAALKDYDGAWLSNFESFRLVSMSYVVVASLHTSLKVALWIWAISVGDLTSVLDTADG